MDVHLLPKYGVSGDPTTAPLKVRIAVREQPHLQPYRELA
jgi:hypothetical protein